MNNELIPETGDPKSFSKALEAQIQTLLSFDIFEFRILVKRPKLNRNKSKLYVDKILKHLPFFINLFCYKLSLNLLLFQID